MHLNGHGLVFGICAYRQAGRGTAACLLVTATTTDGWSAPRLAYLRNTHVHTYIHT